ncbi:MAG: glutamate racemase [Thermacetogeniaceae bacterium]
MSSNQPIGVFDSGVGGLSVVKQMLAQLPDEYIVYFGDTARVPYGSRTSNEIIAFGEQIVSFLLRFDVKAVVAACNTSSSVSLPVLRENCPVPVLGVVEPGVRAALEATHNRQIGVMATAATVNSGAYSRCFQAYDPGVTVYTLACPRFVPLVEAGRIDGPEVRAIARQYLQPLREAGVDTIVLGCTHYPFLAPVIEELAGEAITVVDPAKETVKELSALLASLPPGSSRSNAASGVDSKAAEPERHRFFASGAVNSFYSSGRQFLGNFPFRVEQVNLDEIDSKCSTGGQ